MKFYHVIIAYTALLWVPMLIALCLTGCTSGPRFVIGQDVVVTKGFFEGCEGKVKEYKPWTFLEDEFKVELGSCNGVFVGSEVLGKSELKPLYSLTE